MAVLKSTDFIFSVARDGTDRERMSIIPKRKPLKHPDKIEFLR